MPLVSATLASGLEALVPTNDEAEAIQRIVDAWEGYFDGSQLGPAAAVPGSYAAALAALQAGLTGMSAANAAANAFQTGLTAFWATIAPLAAAVWPQTPPPVTTPPATPPPTLGGVAALLQAQWTADAAAGVDLATSAQNMATILHTNAGLGGIGIITFPGPPPVPTPTPIT